MSLYCPGQDLSPQLCLELLQYPLHMVSAHYLYPSAIIIAALLCHCQSSVWLLSSSKMALPRTPWMEMPIWTKMQKVIIWLQYFSDIEVSWITGFCTILSVAQTEIEIDMFRVIAITATCKDLTAVWPCPPHNLFTLHSMQILTEHSKHPSPTEMTFLTQEVISPGHYSNHQASQSSITMHGETSNTHSLHELSILSN